MTREWNLLQLGTRIKIKGEKEVEGTIEDYFIDKEEIKEYKVKLLDDKSVAIVALDDKIEVCK